MPTPIDSAMEAVLLKLNRLPESWRNRASGDLCFRPVLIQVQAAQIIWL